MLTPSHILYITNPFFCLLRGMLLTIQLWRGYDGIGTDGVDKEQRHNNHFRSPQVNLGQLRSLPPAPRGSLELSRAPRSSRELYGALPGALGLSPAFPGISRASLASPGLPRPLLDPKNLMFLKKRKKHFRKSGFRNSVSQFVYSVKDRIGSDIPLEIRLDIRPNILGGLLFPNPAELS